MPKHSKIKSAIAKMPVQVKNNQRKVSKPVSAQEIDVENGIKAMARNPRMFGRYHTSGLGKLGMAAMGLGLAFSPTAIGLMMAANAGAGNGNSPAAGGGNAPTSNGGSGTGVGPQHPAPNGSQAQANITTQTQAASISPQAGNAQVFTKAPTVPLPDVFDKQAQSSNQPKQNKKSKSKHKNQPSKRHEYQEKQRKRLEAQQKLKERQEKLRKDQQALHKALVSELEQHFIPEIIAAFGGAEKMAQYPIYRSENYGAVGYNVPFEAVKDKVSITVSSHKYEKDAFHDAFVHTEYTITLRYEKTEANGEKHIEVETFGNRGYSGGVYKMVDGKRQRNSERACVLNFTPKDTAYLKDLLEGKSVQDRFGSWGVAKEKVASGEIPMWSEQEEKEKQECLNTPPSQEYCYFSGTMGLGTVRLSDDPAPRHNRSQAPRAAESPAAEVPPAVANTPAPDSEQQAELARATRPPKA